MFLLKFSHQSCYLLSFFIHLIISLFLKTNVIALVNELDYHDFLVALLDAYFHCLWQAFSYISSIHPFFEVHSSAILFQFCTYSFPIQEFSFQLM